MTEPSSSTTRKPKADDRNLVAADGAGATFEDKLNEIWTKNRGAVLAVIVAMLLVVVGRYVWDSYQVGRENAIRAQFGAATTVAAKLEFAQKNKGHPLAGMAILAVADDAYSREDFTAAANYYAQARAELNDPIFVERARLGEGVTSLQAGLGSKGDAILRELASDSHTTASIRSEAWYHIAEYATTTGDTAKAREALDRLDALDTPSMWQQRGAQMRAKLPPESPAAAGSPAAPAAKP